MAIVYKFEVSLKANQEVHESWEFPFEWGRYQWVPELTYSSSQRWLPFSRNSQIKCDIRKLKEGKSAEITLKNTSERDESTTLLLLLHINEHVNGKDSDFLLRPMKDIEDSVVWDELRVSEPKLEFKLIHIERIWEEASTVGENIPGRWTELNLNHDALRGFGDFITKRTDVFDRDCDKIIITHQKTYATLFELNRYINTFDCQSLDLTYVGIDTGENLIAVCKFLEQTKIASKRVNILWTKWDRAYGSSVVDYLKESVLNVLDVDYTFNQEDDIYNHYADRRADVMILTYVVPWMKDFKRDFSPYAQMVLKHNSTVLVVVPPSENEISRDHGSIEKIPETDDWNQLNFEVAFDQNPSPDSIQGCVSLSLKFKGMNNNLPYFDEKQNQIVAIQGRERSYQCSIKSFDSRKPPLSYHQTENLFEDLLTQLERDDEVLLIDPQMLQPNKPPLLPVHLHIDDLGKLLLLMLDKEPLRWESICQRFENLTTPADFLKHQKRRRITLCVKNAGMLTAQVKSRFCADFHDSYENVRIVFVHKDWTVDDMRLAKSNYSNLNLTDEELKPIEIAAARVINQCLGLNNVRALRDAKIIELLGEHHEFTVYPVVSENEIVFQVDCFSLDYLHRIVMEVCKRDTNLSQIRLRTNSQNHTTTFPKAAWDDFRKEKSPSGKLNDP